MIPRFIVASPTDDLWELEREACDQRVYHLLGASVVAAEAEARRELKIDALVARAPGARAHDPAGDGNHFSR